MLAFALQRLRSRRRRRRRWTWRLVNAVHGRPRSCPGPRLCCHCPGYGEQQHRHQQLAVADRLRQAAVGPPRDLLCPACCVESVNCQAPRANVKCNNPGQRTIIHNINKPRLRTALSRRDRGGAWLRALKPKKAITRRSTARRTGPRRSCCRTARLRCSRRCRRRRWRS